MIFFRGIRGVMAPQLKSMLGGEEPGESGGLKMNRPLEIGTYNRLWTTDARVAIVHATTERKEDPRFYDKAVASVPKYASDRLRPGGKRLIGHERHVLYDVVLASDLDVDEDPRGMTQVGLGATLVIRGVAYVVGDGHQEARRQALLGGLRKANLIHTSAGPDEASEGALELEGALKRLFGV